MAANHERRPLRRVGSLWKPQPGAKSLGSGSITTNGYRQRFVVLANNNKTAGSNQPDYVLMSGDEPEVDQYASRGLESRPEVRNGPS